MNNFFLKEQKRMTVWLSFFEKQNGKGRKRRKQNQLCLFLMNRSAEMHLTDKYNFWKQFFSLEKKGIKPSESSLSEFPLSVHRRAHTDLHSCILDFCSRSVSHRNYSLLVVLVLSAWIFGLRTMLGAATCWQAIGEVRTRHLGITQHVLHR